MKKKPQLVGIAGKAGAGKDTLATMLALEHDYSITSFASPLKNCVSTLFGVDLHHFYDREIKEAVMPDIGLSPRQIMQQGADGLRSTFGQDLFIRIWQRTWVQHLPYSRLLVSDVRTREEACCVQELGGVVVYLARPFLNEITGVTASHPTEHFSAGWADKVLCNDGTLRDLRKKAQKLFD